MRKTPAEIILQDLGITEPNEIDLEAIAWIQGARIRYRKLESCEARIIGHGDRAIITVNEQSSPRRQRFSVAHELGHWKWHRGRLLVCRADEIGNGDTSRPQIERTADEFAADLLMPNYLFLPISGSFRKLTFKTVSEIADTFDVSRTAAAIRLVETGHAPSLLVCHSYQGRKWFTRSPEVPKQWFPQDKLDAASFAFDVLFGDQPDDQIPRRMGADAWFDRWGADRFELMEQTIRTSKDQVLTLLLVIDDEMLEERERFGTRSW